MTGFTPPVSVFPLAFLPEGARGVMREIRGGFNVRRRLYELGLTEGTPVSVVRSLGPGPIVIEVRGARIALGRGVSMKVLVEVMDDKGSARRESQRWKIGDI